MAIGKEGSSPEKGVQGHEGGGLELVIWHIHIRSLFWGHIRDDCNNRYDFDDAKHFIGKLKLQMLYNFLLLRIL